MRCLVSIHDVMSATLPEIRGILEILKKADIHAVTLLIVPESKWSESDIAFLRSLQDAGYELAGHGLTHQCATPKTFGHILHSRVISRNVAEHLSRPPQQIAALIEQSFHWFLHVNLQPPAVYVPPAWAMGRISRTLLSDLPFTRYEYLTGIYDTASRTFSRLPLMGYEADTFSRVWMLRMFNLLNRTVARFTNLPIRVAIHPYDLQLGLSSELLRLLKRPARFITYHDIS